MAQLGGFLHTPPLCSRQLLVMSSGSKRHWIFFSSGKGPAADAEVDLTWGVGMACRQRRRTPVRPLLARQADNAADR